MKISTFSGTQAYEMKYVNNVLDLYFEDLALQICKSSWSPFLFKNDDTGRQIRLKSHFAGTDLLVFDIDEGLTLTDAIEICKNDFVVIATTKSHQIEKKSGSKVKPPCDRFRVIKVLERTITSDVEYHATWIFEAKRLGCVDEQCKDIARFYFPCRDVAFQNNGVKTQIRQPEPESIPENRNKQNIKPAQTKCQAPKGEQGRLFSSTFDFIQNGTDRNWHKELLKAALDLKEQGYSYDSAVDLLNRATKKYDGSLDEHDWLVISDVYQNRGGKFEKRSYDLSFQNREPSKFEPPSDDDLAKTYNDEASLRRSANENSLTFLDPAFDEQFKITYGITIIGGKTGHGKSTVCHNLIAQALLSERCSKRILLLSNEETLEETYSKLACLMLRYDWKRDYKDSSDLGKQHLVDAMSTQLFSRVTIVTSKSGKYDTSDLDDVKSILEHAKTESKKYSLVIIDYLQTITTCKSRPNYSTWEISKNLGSYLKKYAQESIVPIIVFAQLKPNPKDQSDFGSRIQNDQTFANHAHTLLEVTPDYSSSTTTIQCHKHRWGVQQDWRIILRFEKGKLYGQQILEMGGVPIAIRSCKGNPPL